MLMLIIDASHLSDDECGSSKEDGESCECNCEPSKDKYESSASEYELSDEEFDNYGGFFYNEDMDVYCHPPFVASIKLSNSSTGLAIVAATTTMSYNVDQKVYVSSDKEEEETDKKDPRVSVSCDEPSISSSEEEEEISIPLCFILNIFKIISSNKCGSSRVLLKIP